MDFGRSSSKTSMGRDMNAKISIPVHFKRLARWVQTGGTNESIHARMVIVLLTVNGSLIGMCSGKLDEIDAIISH